MCVCEREIAYPQQRMRESELGVVSVNEKDSEHNTYGTWS